MEQSLSVPEQDRQDRLARFGAAIDALKVRIEREVGADDVQRVKRLQRFSRAMEVTGRLLIHFSFEPITFVAGTVCLWLHKQLQATEIGHTVLHGAYDGLPDAERFASSTWWWATPIDERSWKYGHNVRHHGATNVAGKDADIHFGPVRLTEQTPYRPGHRWQLLFALAVLFPNFGFLMNLHFTGVSDAYLSNGLGDRDLDFLSDRTGPSRRRAWKTALRKFAPYYALEYVVYPALAGPFFWKVLLANWLSETMRDIYSAATIFCGHVGPEVASFPAGASAPARGEWCAMQVEASNDYEVPYAISVLCGGLDRQIEHHLFPRLPPERLRQVAPEVRAICEAHGVRYATDTWPRTLRRAFGWIATLSHDRSAVGTTRAVMQSMA